MTSRMLELKTEIEVLEDLVSKLVWWLLLTYKYASLKELLDIWDILAYYKTHLEIDKQQLKSLVHIEQKFNDINLF